MDDLLTAATLQKALSDIAIKAVTPLLQRAARATASRLNLRKPNFVEAYSVMLDAKSADIPVLSLYRTAPASLTLADIKKALNSTAALGFIRQLTAIYIIGDAGTLEQRGVWNTSRDRTYYAFSTYLAQVFNISYKEPADEANSDSRLRISRQEFSQFTDATFRLLDRYSSIAAECLTKQAKDRGYAISWAQATNAGAVLESIERYAELTAGKSAISLGDRNQWVDDYRTAFIARHRSIPLPDLDTRRTVPYEELYVEPNVLTEDGQSCDLISLIDTIDRTVILGDPGAGKSTMSSVIAMRYGESRKFIPFHIVMREIDMSKAGFSVVREIESRLASHYQVEPLKEIVERLLTTGEAALIFDGLDELLDPTMRRQAASIIEVAADRFPLAPIMVTCRRVGYSQGQLDPERFQQLAIDKFDEERIRKYVSNWFSISEKLAQKSSGRPIASGSNIEENVNDFMRSSTSIREMTANPLLLSFICVIYRGRGYIPRNRPQLFEKCVDLLLRAWDASRGISQEIANDSYELVLGDVADAVASTPDYFQNGVPERILKGLFANYLTSDAGYPPASARKAATSMVEHCRNRAWIFCDVGQPNDDEVRYAFTHSSFLEYFRALSLTRRITDPQILAGELYGLLLRGGAQITVQVAIHLYDRHVKGGGSVCTVALAEKIAASTSELGKEAIAALDVVLEGSDAIPLKVDAVFVLCRELVIQIIGPMSRRASDIVQLFGNKFRHQITVAMVFPKVLRALIGYGDEIAQLRLCWLLSSVDRYIPSDAEWDKSFSALERINSNASGLKSILTAQGIPARRAADGLSWPLALRFDVLPEKSMYSLGGEQLFRRLFEPCVDHIAKIGDDMSAVWIIRSVGSHRPSEQWTSACRRTLNVLGALFLEETGNLDRFNHLIVPEVWIDHIRTEGTHLLSSGVMASAVYRSDEYDDCTKIGLGLVILGILDVFHELVPSAKIRHSLKDSYDERFQLIYQLLVERASHLRMSYFHFLDSWRPRQIWIPEGSYLQDVS